MRLCTAISVLLTLLAAVALALQEQRSIDVCAWPLSDAKPQSLVTVSYNTSSASAKSYKPPKIPTGDDIVRIGFYHPSGSWSGVATAASNFADTQVKTLQLHTNLQGEVYHVGFKARPAVDAARSDGLAVELVKMKEGPKVHLNKPVVLSPDGKVEEKEPVKTFLQKYWWIIAGFLVLQVVLSASGKE